MITKHSYRVKRVIIHRRRAGQKQQERRKYFINKINKENKTSAKNLKAYLKDCDSISHSNKDAFPRTNTTMGAVKTFQGNILIVYAKYNFDLSNASITQDKVFYMFYMTMKFKGSR